MGRRVSIDELLKLNTQIENQNLIYTGQTINIPKRDIDIGYASRNNQEQNWETDVDIFVNSQNLDQEKGHKRFEGNSELNNDIKIDFEEGLNDMLQEFTRPKTLRELVLEDLSEDLGKYSFNLNNQNLFGFETECAI